MNQQKRHNRIKSIRLSFFKTVM